jgi:hypothetical protein
MDMSHVRARPIWLASLTVAALALALVQAPRPAQAAAPSFTAPLAHGVADYGTTVTFGLSACSAHGVRAVVHSEQAVFRGPVTSGCQGTVAIPTEEQLASAEPPVQAAEVTAVALEAVDGDGTAVASLPLRPQRLEAEHLRVVAGEDAAEGAEDDRFSPSRAVAISGDGATLSLGTVDLTGISSLSLRYALPAQGAWLCAGACHAGTIVLQTASGMPVASQELPRKSRAWTEWERLVLPILSAPEGPAELHLRILPPAPRCNGAGVALPTLGGCGSDRRVLRLNYVELNGTGTSQRHTFPADPEGTVVLFDGTSFNGWTMAGGNCLGICLPGNHGFELRPEERALRTNGVFGLLWYSARQFTDYVLRLEFRTEEPFANSGVYAASPTRRATGTPTTAATSSRSTTWARPIPSTPRARRPAASTASRRPGGSPATLWASGTPTRSASRAATTSPPSTAGW